VVAATCFVLVAGGLGERLGYSGIKVALPTELTTGLPYLAFYLAYFQKLQAQYRSPIQLAIMVGGSAPLPLRDPAMAAIMRGTRPGVP
jgi:UDP-sugar pyrophosphorylase